MKKRILCLALCLGLCLGFAQAAEPAFSDVKAGDWFAPYVAICAQMGLMKGTGDGKFTPQGTITVAEVAAIAARLGETINGAPILYGTAAPGESLPWYHWYVEHLKGYGVTVDRPQEPASRQDFISFLAAVTPIGSLAPINSISALPDTADMDVLAFYNAGILTGVDDYGTFAPERTLTRSEAAAMTARVLQADLRLSFVPQQQPALPPDVQDPGQFPEDTAMTVNGTPVSLDALADWVNLIAYQTDMAMATYYNSRLDLSDPSVVQGLMRQAQLQAAAEVLLEEKAAQLGCTVDTLAAALTPSPTPGELDEFVRLNDLLCAKHILVGYLQSAQAVLDGLNAVPTLEQFNTLLTVFGTDPGMTGNPDGYLFGPGQMVPEFESATRALDIGAYSLQPVQSSYGYHIIWRLDPTEHPDILPGYQSMVLEQQVNAWLREADIYTDPDMLARINVSEAHS